MVVDLASIGSSDRLRRHRTLDRSAALETFVSLLAAGTDDVGRVLGDVLGRPDLRIAYWLPDAERWVDRDGARRLIDVSQPGVAVVSYRGERVGALVVDGPPAEPLDLQGPLMGAVGLALENERLRLALQARLEEQQALRRVATAVARQHAPGEVFALVASEVARHLGADAAMTARFDGRARIVEAADAARRKIERDLHDGAQQRLVSLALSLAMLAKTADPATAAAVKACADELQAALGELRELARGIHPAVLTERGLEAALQALAARSPVPVELEGKLDGRLPPAREAALCFVAAEALTNVAKYAQATAARVTLRTRDGWAEVTIADDGVGGASASAGSGLRGLADRLEALGGTMTVESRAGTGTTVRAAVPVAG